MKAKFLSGMLYSTFRLGRSSVHPGCHGKSTRKFSEKASGPVTQRMQCAKKYDRAEDLVCPVQYFKEELGFLKSLDENELLGAAEKKGRSEVRMEVARAARSLPELILKRHAIGIACGDSLKLSNIRISRSIGKFVFVEPPKPTDRCLRLVDDFSRGADVLEELASSVLGPGARMPKVWDDFLDKLREQCPRVHIIMYHSLFLSLNLRYCLRVIVDQRFRKDFGSLKKEQKDAIRKFIEKLGMTRKEDLPSLLLRNEFLKFVSLRSRKGAQGRRGKSNSQLSTQEAVWSDKGRSIIAFNRDGVVHGCKDDPNDKEIAAMPNIQKHWRTQENVIQLLCEEFELLDQSYIELCDDDEKILWKLVRIWELFGETEGYWQAAIAALHEESKASLANGSTKCEVALCM
ncbi:uncharacterized protein [Triticum aestivum]|uniref:uncharacterized protein n=1 Tax=Triticum aestivum TaxID=4565 RepID=UPI001D02F813|nr:uncharacterized protein LOC123090773 [Triticum aestivum]XP_044368046.1 uncharacterized protein LOC123090773 [Triticum aestivum]